MILKCADFKPEEYFRNVPLLKNRRGNPAGKKRKYIGLTCAFDIETTLLEDIQQSVMYIWQFQLSTDYTIIGRTWDEFTDFLKKVKAALPADRWLVCFIHNASFEFQYLKGIYDFKPEEIFALASRKVLKFDMFGCFEFRCSYKLTNMSLKEFTDKMNVEHKKLSGDDFDYSKDRFPWTPLSDEELAYCVNDVLGLVEAINALMARDGDTLSTIPLTSTGYVRRDAKRAMRQGIHHNFVYSILPDYEIYCALAEAFRGGNTHASRFFADDIVTEVHSVDISSSYPSVLCNCEFPMTQFIPIISADLNEDYIARCMNIRHKALLLRIKLTDVHLRDEYWGCPYLSTDKCRNLVNVQDTEDNGRILRAESLETTVTDIDLKIIMKEYHADKIYFLQGWYASYKKLPDSLINLIVKYYKDKTKLKNVEGKEIFYDKAKALLNACFGMMAQSSIKPKIIYVPVGDWHDSYTSIMENESLTDEQKKAACEEIDRELLGKYNEKAFLAYQWGVWCTSWARARLESGIELAHKYGNFCYTDTDSVKYIGDVDFSEFNKERVAECMESGSFAEDPSGKVHYMGVFESEDNPETGYCYATFKTLGAKKYAYTKIPGGPTFCTIAGVNKKKGGAELDAHGGLKAFQDGFIFREAGGTEAVYNDAPQITEIEIDGNKLRITSNLTILPSEYKLGITGEYERIIKYAKNYLYNPYVI